MSATAWSQQPGSSAQHASQLDDESQRKRVRANELAWEKAKKQTSLSRFFRFMNGSYLVDEWREHADEELKNLLERALLNIALVAALVLSANIAFLVVPYKNGDETEFDDSPYLRRTFGVLCSLSTVLFLLVVISSVRVIGASRSSHPPCPCKLPFSKVTLKNMDGGAIKKTILGYAPEDPAPATAPSWSPFRLCRAKTPSLKPQTMSNDQVILFPIRMFTLSLLLTVGAVAILVLVIFGRDITLIVSGLSIGLLIYYFHVQLILAKNAAAAKHAIATADLMDELAAVIRDTISAPEDVILASAFAFNAVCAAKEVAEQSLYEALPQALPQETPGLSPEKSPTTEFQCRIPDFLRNIGLKIKYTWSYLSGRYLLDEWKEQNDGEKMKTLMSDTLINIGLVAALLLSACCTFLTLPAVDGAFTPDGIASTSRDAFGAILSFSIMVLLITILSSVRTLMSLDNLDGAVMKKLLLGFGESKSSQDNEALAHWVKGHPEIILYPVRLFVISPILTVAATMILINAVYDVATTIIVAVFGGISFLIYLNQQVNLVQTLAEVTPDEACKTQTGVVDSIAHGFDCLKLACSAALHAADSKNVDLQRKCNGLVKSTQTTADQLQALCRTAIMREETPLQSLFATDGAAFTAGTKEGVVDEEPAAGDRSDPDNNEGGKGGGAMFDSG